MCEKEIRDLENKRSRSQSALLNAVVSNVPPDPEDVKYFKGFTDLIEIERQRMRDFKDKLSKL